jgi:hypothetical protein
MSGFSIQFAFILMIFKVLPLCVFGQNIMSVKNANGESGQIVYVEIEITNFVPFVAFQFDLTYSGSAFTFDKPLSALTDRKDGHSLSLSEPAPGTIRAISYSSSLKSFKGNSGAVIRIAFRCSTQQFGGFPFNLSNAIIGNSSSQNILNQTNNGTITIGKTQTITLNQGWTWFSLNIKPVSWKFSDVMGAYSPKDGDYIKNQTTSITFYDGFGWFGELQEFDPKTMYKIKLSSAAVITIFGTPVNSAEYPITINQGWTWIGYLPQLPLSITDALSSINPVGNEYIKNQTVSTMFYAGSGWFGELMQLKPGDGYMIYTGHQATLQYTN